MSVKRERPLGVISKLPPDEMHIAFYISEELHYSMLPRCTVRERLSRSVLASSQAGRCAAPV